jgi:hypothetical protein
VIQWIRDNNVHDQIAGYLQAETEQKERATLTALQNRYGVLPIANTATGDLPSAPTPTHIEIHVPVQEVGQLRLF